jgi:hypothetical protein
MTIMQTPRTTYTPRASLVGALGLALLAAGACGKKENRAADTAAAGGAVAATPASNVQVADVKLGKHISADKKVTDETDSFKARDTIYASVHTTGSASSAQQLTARWMFETGQQVDERTESISPTGDTYTEFHIAKPSGWPPGKYMLHVMLNGQQVQMKEFTVSK